MPIYEYRCNKCSACFELKQSFTDSPSATCESCGGEARRLFSPVPIVFKGSGFYVTDNAARNNTLENKKNGSKSPSASVNSDTSSDTGALSTAKKEDGSN